MSAELITCGHTLHGFIAELMEVLLTKDSPHVHTHVLTDAEDFKIMGFRRVELCCHGCGQSVLVLHDDGDTRRVTLEREQFLQAHKSCPDHGFTHWCPDVRTSFYEIDMRKSDSSKKSQQDVLTRSKANVKTRLSPSEA